MQSTSGNPAIKIGLIDGPVHTSHPELAAGYLGELPVQINHPGLGSQSAGQHGTFIAGILSARRSSQAPAICPSCTLLIRPVAVNEGSGNEALPCAPPQEISAAIVECVNSGARVINLSLTPAGSSLNGEQLLKAALDYAVRRGVIVVAAAGNPSSLSAAITRHPWVLPVVACDRAGRALHESALDTFIGRRGLTAPGEGIISLGVDGQARTLGGTSVATPFVTGTIALLWSRYRTATASQIKHAVSQGPPRQRPSSVPPLLNGDAACELLRTSNTWMHTA